MDKIKFHCGPHEISEKNKAQKIKIAKRLLQLLELGERKWLDIITDKESWIVELNSHITQWLLEGSLRPRTPSLTIGGKKSMIFVFFSLQAVLTVLFLRNGDTFNSDFLTNAVFLEIGTKIAEQRLQNALKKKWFWIWIALLVIILGRQLTKLRS
jgi:hypothetical protein